MSNFHSDMKTGYSDAAFVLLQGELDRGAGQDTHVHSVTLSVFQ